MESREPTAIDDFQVMRSNMSIQFVVENAFKLFKLCSHMNEELEEVGIVGRTSWYLFIAKYSHASKHKQ